jgi:hypothetical protein
MNDESNHQSAGVPEALRNRRTAMKLGALGMSAVLTIKPALAQAASSVVYCEIPVPDSARAGQWVAADGTVVAANTEGAFAPPPGPLRGEDVRNALAGNSLPGQGPEASQAYMNYVRRLQSGQSGFTCFASLQMPGR